MNRDKEPTQPTTRSAEAKRFTVALIGAGACVGVAVIAAVLFFLS